MRADLIESQLAKIFGYNELSTLHPATTISSSVVILIVFKNLTNYFTCCLLTFFHMTHIKPSQVFIVITSISLKVNEVCKKIISELLL